MLTNSIIGYIKDINRTLMIDIDFTVSDELPC